MLQMGAVAKVRTAPFYQAQLPVLRSLDSSKWKCTEQQYLCVGKEKTLTSILHHEGLWMDVHCVVSYGGISSLRRYW